MSWANCDGKPFTMGELKEKAKSENSIANHIADSDSDTEPEIPEPVKKPTKKTTKKSKKSDKSETTTNQEHFVKQLDLFNLDGSDENECQDISTETIDFTETRIVVSGISKELKGISSRISALKTVVQDLALTDIPKNVSQVIKEVEKLRELLCNLGINVPVAKQQRKKAK
ncbi:SWPV1-164 [Shearwaterpox virus]|uniref:SWPV1-164 n=1 Tax=Shearwaterpox virus TaxID=1974596 RepID=A0A1V0S7Y7_CNPV|nr:SWPV1-164 [Shearwaterpox virus]